MDINVSVFINNKNKNENIKDFHSFCKGKRINFKDNFGNITVSLFVGIGNNISIYTNNDDKDKYFIYFSNFIMINKGNFIDNFNDECVSFIMGIGNNINVYIVEVPNETAPSIQGFAKPPA